MEGEGRSGAGVGDCVVWVVWCGGFGVGDCVVWEVVVVVGDVSVCCEDAVRVVCED
ncbi:hypothetical protein Hamer_G001400 [Homarus americanus]|uniref:Uncharacterized protein n=1 Tax=Homarus americanus TaxID=6706 RepID=A0A8J5N9N7_HOMAM|nr:hypothetical protein Hamer_G001400 [Homarus americanus]